MRGITNHFFACLVLTKSSTRDIATVDPVPQSHGHGIDASCMCTRKHARRTPASRHGAMARLGPRRRGSTVSHLRWREAILVAGHDGRVEAVLRVGVAQTVERGIGIGAVAWLVKKRR